MAKHSTYWVSFSWTYKYQDPETGELTEEEESEAMRFQCPKKDIKKRVKEYVDDWADVPCKDIKITIDDYYLTTEYEI